MRSRHGLLLLTILLTTFLFAQAPPAPQELFQRALALHDSGDYAGAIAIYQELLASYPGNEQVAYELAFSTFAKGDMDEAIRLASGGAKRPNPYQARYLELLGNAYDTQHKTREAIAAYKQGIRIQPKYATLHYNLGVTYSGANRLREAREEFERAIELDSTYASAHFAIAQTYRMDGYRVPAILAYGRFLSLSREGERAATAAAYLQSLLNLGVQAEPGGETKNVNITIDPASRKDLGDFGGLEMMAAIASSSRFLTENGPKSEHDREAEALGSFFAMFSESSGSLKRGFIAKTYAPFYAALQKAGHESTLAHLALVSMKLPGTEEWARAHTEEVESFNAWLQHAGTKD